MPSYCTYYTGNLISIEMVKVAGCWELNFVTFSISIEIWVKSTVLISARPNWLRSIDKRGNSIQSLSVTYHISKNGELQRLDYSVYQPLVLIIKSRAGVG